MPYFVSIRRPDGMVVAEWKAPGTEFQIVARETFPTATVPTVGTRLPAVQQVRVAGPASASPTSALSTQASVAALIGLLLPAVQKVREAASRNASTFTTSTVRPGSAASILPYLDQENLFLRSVKTGAGGAIALSPVNPHQAKPKPTTLGGQQCLVFYLGGTAGKPSVVLENGIVQVEQGGGGKPPLLLIGYSSSRVA